MARPTNQQQKVRDAELVAHIRQGGKPCAIHGGGIWVYKRMKVLNIKLYYLTPQEAAVIEVLRKTP